MKICTPIGTQNVRLDRDEIVGAWQNSLSELCIPRGRLLVEDFVNWGNQPADILRFTNQFAPLAWQKDPIPEWARPTGGAEFRFTIGDWQAQQESFRRIWEAFAGGTYKNTGIAGLCPADAIEIHDKQLFYKAGSLRGFLLLELITAPLERFRKCGHPECETPYFLARHLKERYCSPACAEWAQRKWKERWWKAEGKKWLDSRSKAKKKMAEKLLVKKPRVGSTKATR